MKKELFCSDNLPVLESMESEVVDLIYLDPPFGIGKDFYKNEVGYSDRWNNAVGEGKKLSSVIHRLIEFVELSMGKKGKNYFIFMAVRLVEMHRVLKNTGTIYLHCDSTFSHYLKLLLDVIFGVSNFRNEIIWCYDRWDALSRDFQRMHDVVLRYSKSKEFYFSTLTEIDSRREKTLERGYTTSLLKNGIKQLIVYKGNEDRPNIKKLMEKKKFNKVIIRGARGRPLKDYWIINILNSQTKERTGYPTQKPLVLLERIIKSSSKEGDIILDPFCGSGTTCVVAKRLEREWIGIDINEDAIKIAQDRLRKEF